MFDVVALGELLIDFTCHGQSENGMKLFEQNPGGAPANVLCALSKLGKKCAFIGKVGKDMHGDFLRDTLNKNGIDTSSLISSPEAFTTLAFVELSEDGERRFSFVRNPGADTLLAAGDLNSSLISSCKIFHFGSLSLTAEPARSATLAAVKAAKALGTLISYDPNYRPSLWENAETAVRHMCSVLHLVDLIKISDDECSLVTGKNSPEEAAEALLKMGVSCVAVTLGNMGSYVAANGFSIKAPAFDSRVVDTTGAGDSFLGAFLFKLLESKIHPSMLTEMQIGEFSRFANAAASLCVGKRGAIPALPGLKEISDLLSRASI